MGERSGGRTRLGVIRLYQLLILLALVGVSGIYLINEFIITTPHPNVRVFMELEELAISFEAFKDRFGQYPPNFEDMDQVAQFVDEAFPQYKAGTSTPYPESLDAAEALVFWLSRISTDPADPFAKDAKTRIEFHFFHEPFLRDGRYYPSELEGEQPFVYFAHSCYATATYRGLRPYVRSEAGGVKQYFADKAIQIVAAGRDRKLGRGGVITELSEEDRDNVVSFSTQLVGDIDPDE